MQNGEKSFLLLLLLLLKFYFQIFQKYYVLMFLLIMGLVPSIKGTSGSGFGSGGPYYPLNGFANEITSKSEPVPVEGGALNTNENCSSSNPHHGDVGFGGGLGLNLNNEGVPDYCCEHLLNLEFLQEDLVSEDELLPSSSSTLSPNMDPDHGHGHGHNSSPSGSVSVNQQSLVWAPGERAHVQEVTSSFRR
jgi:hypothetical protein